MPPERAAKAILEKVRLPISDITRKGLRHFLGYWAGRRLVGVVGLELCGKAALLRSLAVRPQYRGRGLGRRLVASIEQRARRLRIGCLYLLTTTAEEFFARGGYETIERSRAPKAIRATAEFQSLCPASSVCMRKRLGGTKNKNQP